MTYHFLPSVTTAAGFHYKSFMTNFPEYENPVPNGLYFNPQALGGTDSTFSGYIPFFGAIVDMGLGYTTSLKACIKGLPAMPRSFVYREVLNSTSNYIAPSDSGWNGMTASSEFSSGYFVEAFAQISTPINLWAQVGAFVKYSGVYGEPTTDVNTPIATREKSNPPQPSSYDPISYHNQADVTCQRSSWIFGGTISASF